MGRKYGTYGSDRVVFMCANVIITRTMYWRSSMTVSTVLHPIRSDPGPYLGICDSHASGLEIDLTDKPVNRSQLLHLSPS
jgi:hypothetical protein